MTFNEFSKASGGLNPTFSSHFFSSAELPFAKTSGMVTGDAPISYWSIFPQSPGTFPEVFAKGKSAQFPRS